MKGNKFKSYIYDLGKLLNEKAREAKHDKKMSSDGG